MEVQDMITQNMALWHIKYLKEKESEKTAEAKPLLLSCHPILLKQVIKAEAGNETLV